MGLVGVEWGLLNADFYTFSSTVTCAKGSYALLRSLLRRAPPLPVPLSPCPRPQVGAWCECSSRSESAPEGFLLAPGQAGPSEVRRRKRHLRGLTSELRAWGLGVGWARLGAAGSGGGDRRA